MLDKRTQKLLNHVLSLCGEDGTYKVLEISDLISGLAPRFKVDKEGLEQMMQYLYASQMIDVKYTDENVYCIMVLPKGRIYEEEKLAASKTKAIGKGLAFLIIFGSFLAAIIGAVVGGLIINLLD